MSGTEWALIITAGTGLFVALSTAIGKAASYVIGLVQTQSERTIAALREENKALKDQLALCKREHGT
jgi:hypothetical protein